MPANQGSRPKLHYAWIIAAVTFLVLLATAGIRATPGILIVPLEQEFGWSRATISAAISVNIALFGLVGPFAASWMTRFSLRRIVLAAVGLLAVAVAASSFIRRPWQLIVCWGVLVGLGTGVTSLVLAAVVVNRWFEQRRGLVLGVLSAANATGQLVFLPLLATLVTYSGWRSAVYVVAGTAAGVFVFASRWMKSFPSDLKLLPYGASQAQLVSTQPAPPASGARSGLGGAIAGVLDSGRDFLCLRREHQRVDRHAFDSGMHGPRNYGSQGRGTAGGNGDFRYAGNHVFRLVDRSI